MTEFLGNGPPQYEDLSSHTFSWQGPFSMKVKAITHFSRNPQEKSKNPLHSIIFAIVVATHAIVQRRAMLNFSGN